MSPVFRQVHDQVPAGLVVLTAVAAMLCIVASVSKVVIVEHDVVLDFYTDGVCTTECHCNLI